MERLLFILKHELRLIDDAESKSAPQQMQSDPTFQIEGDYDREKRQLIFFRLSPITYEQQFIVARTLTPADP